MRFSSLYGAFGLLAVAASAPSPEHLFSRAAVQAFNAPELTSVLSSGAKVYQPGDSEFSTKAGRYSDWANPTYVAVIEAATNNDVTLAAKYAIKKNRKFLIQNTGHAWTDWSSTVNAILIKINTIANTPVINSAANTLTIGPGKAFADVVPLLYAAGKEMPTGTCNCVGLTGATLGGGHGRLQGLHGLISDNLLSAKVLLSSGSIVTASASSNSDLYWALRGAGHNFGYVLESTYRIYPQTNGGNHYDGVMLFSGSALEPVFEAVNAYDQPAEASIYVVFFMANADDAEPTIMLDFVYAGPQSEGQAAFDEGFGHLKGNATLRTDDTFAWNELNSKSALGLPGGFCVRGGEKLTFNTGLKSYDVPTMRKVWDGYVKFLADNPGPRFSQSLYLFESYPLQAVQAVDSASTAYPNRDVNIIALPIVWLTDAADTDIGTEYGLEVRTLLESTSGYDDQKVYLNYARGDEDLGSMYGYESWRQSKLTTLKKKYDSTSRFSEYQAIPQVVSGW